KTFQSCMTAVPLSSRCVFFFFRCHDPQYLHSFPTRRSSDLFSISGERSSAAIKPPTPFVLRTAITIRLRPVFASCVTSKTSSARSEEHTSELQSLAYLVCRLLLEKKKK